VRKELGVLVEFGLCVCGDGRIMEILKRFWFYYCYERRQHYGRWESLKWALFKTMVRKKDAF
jgi:hypothetical protein